jgi:tetratricopeptide (TPR) repeat protein
MTPHRIQQKLRQASQFNINKQYVKAKKNCKEVLRKHKDIAIAWKLLATNELCLQQWHDAEVAIKACIELGDNDLATYQLLATCYTESNQLDLAQNLLEELFNQTGNNGLLVDIAMNLHRMGEYQQSKDVYDILLTHEPDNEKALYNRTILALSMGARGDIWQDYKLRHQQKGASTIPTVIAPIWQSEDLTDKHILVWGEQGVADQVIFSRCFADIATDAAQVTVICQQRLLTLMQNTYPTINFYVLDDDNIDPLIAAHFDYQVFAGDLPQHYLFSNQQNAMSAHPMTCPKNFNEELKNRLHDGAKIGVSWFGGDFNADNNNRWSLPTEALNALIYDSDATWYSLQYGDYKKQKQQLVKQNLFIHDVIGFGAAGDFSPYAALIQQMDLVIAVDNAAAIFAAALGKEVWILHPADPFWVWGVHTQQSWYANTRHFVKAWNMDWHTFIEEQVKPALLKRLN